jgi:hypothetical protein
MHPNRFHIAAIAFLIIGLAAIGFANTESDLPLTKPPIRFAIIGDRTGTATSGVYEQIIAEIEQLRPDFVITVGDQIQGYTEDTVSINAQWDEYFDIVKKLTMPLYITPGNHDITNDKMLPIYEKRVGRPNYSFNVRYCHFVVLDVSRADSSSEIPQAQFDWLPKTWPPTRGRRKRWCFSISRSGTIRLSRARKIGFMICSWPTAWMPYSTGISTAIFRQKSMESPTRQSAAPVALSTRVPAIWISISPGSRSMTTG